MVKLSNTIVSWDQMAQYDLPASIDAILRINGADRVYYAGHSQVNHFLCCNSYSNVDMSGYNYSICEIGA